MDVYIYIYIYILTHDDTRNYKKIEIIFPQKKQEQTTQHSQTIELPYKPYQISFVP
jgi:hypothetical protein